MEKIFLEILNMSLSGSLLIFVVLIVRFLLKKAPKWISCVFWGLVAVRLLCPFSIESAISLLPSAKPVPTDIAMMPKPAIDSGIPAINLVVNPVIERNFTPAPVASANPLQIINFVAARIWIMGIIVLFIYAIVSYGLLYKKVRSSITVEENIRLCDYIETPFILGVIRPRIYLPSGVSEEQFYHVIAHEKAHLKRLDHIWKPLGFLVLVIHWFNPLVWVSYVLLCKDMEMACDEKVISDLDKKSAASYSQSLLECSVGRRNILVYPLAFGEVSVKERIKHVLNYKRPRFWIICVAIIACIVVAVCFLTNPKHVDVIEEQIVESNESENVSGTDANDDVAYISKEPETAVDAYYQLLHTIESGMYDHSLLEKNPEAYKDADGEDICSYSEFFLHLYDGRDDIAYQNLGYAILDIDGNGVEELILGASDPRPDGNYNGIIYDLYTFQNQKINHIFSGWPREHYRLTNNNEFVCEWSAGADDSGEDYYRFDGETGSLVKIEELAADSVYVNLEYIPIGPNWHQINDLSGDGLEDYIIYTGMDGYYNRLSLYLTEPGEGKVFEHVDDNYVKIGGMVSAIDIDHDGENEIALSISPRVNSGGLVKYVVLKRERTGWNEMKTYNAENGEGAFPIKILHKGDYTNVISCDGLEKTIGFDVEYVRNYWENDMELPEGYKQEVLSYYDSIYKSITGKPVGYVCEWGMWDINEATYKNDVCLQAHFGIAGYDKFDFWGYLSIYFDYEKNGKIRILDIVFDSVKMELPATKVSTTSNAENSDVIQSNRENTDTELFEVFKKFEGQWIFDKKRGACVGIEPSAECGLGDVNSTWTIWVTGGDIITDLDVVSYATDSVSFKKTIGDHEAYYKIEFTNKGAVRFSYGRTEDMTDDVLICY